MLGNWHAIHVLGEMYRGHQVLVEAVPYGNIFIGIVSSLVCIFFILSAVNEEESKTSFNKEGD